MTSSERISTSRATPSVAPASTPKAASAGADDFAATLTQARGSKNTASASSPPAAKSGSPPEAAAAEEEAQSESTTTASAPKSAKHPRNPKDSKEAKDSADDEDAAASAGQAPEAAAALNGVAIPPATAPISVPSQGDVAAESSAATSSDVGLAALSVGDAANGGTAAGRRAPRASAPSPEASTLAGTLVGQGTAPSIAQTADQTVDQAALTVVTDALQAKASVANAADGNATSAASALIPQTAAPDPTANAALSQLTAAVSASDPASLARNAQSVSQHSLHTAVGARGWSDELATRLTWMVDQRQHVATLRLAPENMGPLEVRIDVRDNQVSVWFGAAQADTRAAIESALPRLRELLQGQGLSLADAGVSQQSHRESPRNMSTPHGAPFGEAEGASEMSVALRVGLFDGYA